MNAEAYELATEIAGMTGETLTTVVVAALRERAARTRKFRDRDARIGRLLEHGRRYSALPVVAVFKGETDADLLLLSAANLLEASVVLSGIRSTLEVGDEWLDRLLAEQNVVIEPVTAAQAQLARLAFRMYGKGRGHGAALNFGDCFSYALAKSLDAPLLFKSGDFSMTDIRPALD